ncbi:MAG TPA: sugar ABC transporter substrate-binding protein [Chloroflexota bacterium]|nr:sugar ABC transporter substrate-binding protein [Chloroflexota bacterium]
MDSRVQPSLSRRRALLLGGGLALTALVAACQSSTPAAAPTAASASSAPAAAPTAASAKSAPAPTTAPTAASSSSTSATPAATAASAGQAVSLSLSYRSGNAPYFKERSTAFNKANPQFTIEQKPIAGSNDAYYPKLSAEFAANSASDVFWVSTGFGMYDNYAFAQQLIAADPFIQSDKVDVGQWFKAAIETLKLDGKLYALPWGMHPDDIGLYYNIDMLQKAGVEAPSVDSETFDSLAQKAVKLTKRTGSHTDIWGIISKTTPFEGLISQVRSFGGDFMSEDKKQAAANTPEFKDAITWFYNVRTQLKCNPLLAETPQAGAETPFVAGTVAMFNSGVWDMSLTDKIGTRFKMGISLMPKGPKGTRGSMAHVDTISGYGKGKNQAQAFKFIEFLTNQESGVQNALANSFFGARPDVWADPRPGQKYGKAYVDVWQTATENTMPLDEPYNFRLLELNTAMDNTMSKVWSGDSTPDKIIPTLQDAMNTVLSKPRQ